jgi:hypothetical protein
MKNLQQRALEAALEKYELAGLNKRDTWIESHGSRRLQIAAANLRLDYEAERAASELPDFFFDWDGSIELRPGFEPSLKNKELLDLYSSFNPELYRDSSGNYIIRVVPGWLRSGTTLLMYA